MDLKKELAPRTFKGLLLEMKLAKSYEERVLAEEQLVSMYNRSVDDVERWYVDAVAMREQRDVLTKKLETADEKQRRIIEVLKYCKPHIDQMWAAVVAGILLDVEFRDAKTALEVKGDK